MAPAKALRLVGALSRGLEESVIRFDDQSALPFEDLGAEGRTARRKRAAIHRASSGLARRVWQKSSASGTGHDRRHRGEFGTIGPTEGGTSAAW